MPEGTGSLRLQIFSDTFGAPGFVRRDLVESGQLSKRTAINSTDGGNTDLQVLAFNYKQRGEQPLNANVYVMHTVLDRFSNRQSTIPIDEGLPGQALQTDDRLTFGGTAEKYFRWGRPLAAAPICSSAAACAWTSPRARSTTPSGA